MLLDFFAWFHHSKSFSSLSLAYTFVFSISIFFLSSGSRFAALAVLGGSLIGFLLSRTVSVKEISCWFRASSDTHLPDRCSTSAQTPNAQHVQQGDSSICAL